MKPSCLHGGRFHSRLGCYLEDLDALASIVPADVLDAWFPPAPPVLEALARHLPALARTAPPSHAEPLARALSDAFHVDPASILPGGGSSALMFLALPHLLQGGQSLAAPDPGYGEYRHLASLLNLEPRGYGLWPGSDEELRHALTSGSDLVVVINPNNPTGWKMKSSELAALVAERSPGTRVWIDEAYAAYDPAIGSLAGYAATHPGVYVCRSLSKSHALSGLRLAALFAHPDTLTDLRRCTPPWSVSFPAQLAAILALQEPGYYLERYRETATLRKSLEAELGRLGLRIEASEANWILAGHERSADIIRLAESQGVFLRDPSSMSSRPWSHSVRVAVRSEAENKRIVCAIREGLDAI